MRRTVILLLLGAIFFWSREGAAQEGVIQIVSGTYGANCGVPKGTHSRAIALACNGKASCTYRFGNATLGDPKVGCVKNYVVEWRCGGGRLYRAVAPAKKRDASVIQLRCRHTIQVMWATYGANCGVPKGKHTTPVAAVCNGKSRCDYLIDHKRLGDPRFGCQKNFVVQYQCLGLKTYYRAFRAAPTGNKEKIVLSCPAFSPKRASPQRPPLLIPRRHSSSRPHPH